MSQGVGLIGVGLMGHGIGLNIQKSGRSLCFLEHGGNQPSDDLIELGANSVSTIEAICKNNRQIILCVTGAPQVEQVILGEGGLCEHIEPGTLVIDCSTSLPQTTNKVSTALKDRGANYLDAPMTRTPKEAEEGRLNLLVGGAKSDFDAAYNLLESFAENIVHTGATSTGHSMKLLHNFVSLGLMGVVAEAASCAKKAGVEDGVFIDVLQKGGGYGAALDRLSSMISNGDPSALKFTLSNALKDLTYYNGMADELSSSDEMAKAMKAKLEGAIEAKSPNSYMPELVSY